VTGDKLRPLPFALLAAIAASIFLVGLGRLPLLGRDEALYAEAGREMVAGRDWVTPRVNGGPFFEKPPLYYWLAAVSYCTFGVTPFAARFPAALMAILTVLLTAQIGARIWGERAGLLAGLALATSLQMAMIGRMGIMDVPLTFLTLLALLAYERWRNGGRFVGSAGFGLCLGLAVLLKGAAGLIPAGVVVVDLIIRALRKTRVEYSRVHLVGAAFLSFCVAVLTAAPWFLVMSARHGGAFGSKLFLHEHVTRVLQPMQGHGGPFWTYLPLIFVSFFPWVILLPSSLLHREEEGDQARFWRGLCVVWALCVLISFSAIRTKLPGYVTPLFPAMALLVGPELARGVSRRTWTAVLAGTVVLAALVALLPLAAFRIGARVGALEEARLVTMPTVIWASGYLIVGLGAGAALCGRPRNSVGTLALGQMTTVTALLFGILPLLSPYLGGGSARLAELAQRELPGSRVILYGTRPENVNFALKRTVPTFDWQQQVELEKELRAAPTALIAPAEQAAFWHRLGARRSWREGDRVLLDMPRLGGGKEAPR